MDLGKSMERLLTLDQRTFTRLLLHRKVGARVTSQTSSIAYQTSTLEHQTTRIKPQTSSIKHHTLNLKPQASNNTHQTSNRKP